MTQKSPQYGKMRRVKWLGVIIIAIVLVVISSSCNWGNKPPERPKVTIGMVTFPGYAPLYLAKEKNLFPDVDVALVRIESIGDLREAINSG